MLSYASEEDIFIRLLLYSRSNTLNLSVDLFEWTESDTFLLVLNFLNKLGFRGEQRACF